MIGELADGMIGELADVDVCELPVFVREMAEHMGMADALRVIEKVGGATYTVPFKPTEDHVLVMEIGMELTEKLSRFCGGQPVFFPTAAKALRCIRNREIVRLYTEEGAKPNFLCRKFGITDRQVWRILGKPLPEEHGRQLAMDFG